MSAIQSTVGLLSGLPVHDIVDQLIEISAIPRNQLFNRTTALESERLAIDRLSSLTLAFQFELNALGSGSLFTLKTATSSDSGLLAASVASGGQPAPGSFQFTPVRTASNQQFVSNSFEELTSAFESGSLSFGFGGFVDKGIDLDQLNSGAGFEAGEIRITDRSGETAVIDLSYAFTVDDVLDAINSDTTINVTASTDGDTFTLTDNTGGGGNLIVQEVGSGTTAASLGLAGINVAADEATGSDVFSLHDGTKLSFLNDGSGVQIRAEGTNDLTITFRDESDALEVDLSGLTTVGDVIDKLNEDSRLVAAISADGNRIEVTDQTAGAGNFSIASVGTGTAAEDLGIVASTTSDTITGERLVSGLRDTLLSSLNGGQGIGTPGVIDITNRDGVLSNVDLSGAETLGDVVDAINAQATDVTAAINTQRHGIVLTDETGNNVSNFIIADGDANNSATALGIVVDDELTEVSSSSLHRQTISEATLLADLNHGEGIDLADFTVTDTDGAKGAIDLNETDNEAVTVGDVIDRINASSADVLARINDTGDGILIVDQANGSGQLQVADVGSGTAAADLNLLGLGVDNGGTQEIDGTSVSTIDLSDLSLTSDAILLSSLNAGAGISRGDFIIESSKLLPDGETPVSFAIDLDGADSDVLTVAQLVDRINTRAAAAGVAVEASINSSGTGIELTDTAGGAGTLTVRDVGNDTAATELGLTIDAKIDGDTQTINATGLFTTDDAAEAGLNTLADRINELDLDVTASVFFDGGGYRLSLSVDKSGAGNELLIDAGDVPLTFEEVSKAQDAVLQFGSQSGGVLLRSNDNQFENVVNDINVTIKGTSDDPVTVTVAANTKKITDSVQDLVDAYNSLRTELDAATDFNEDDLTTGILFGTNAALRVDTDLANVLSGSFPGLGTFDSLGAIGLKLDEDGKLSLDSGRLLDAFESDPVALQRFFTDEGKGVVAKIGAVIDSLAADDSSLLATRSQTLADIVEQNSARIQLLDERLERERDRLLLEFTHLEETIASLRQNLNTLSSLQVLPAITETGSGAASLFNRN